MIALKICKTQELFEEVCRVLKESEQVEFDFMEQIFNLHDTLADQIQSEDLLYEMREFSTNTQEIAIKLFDQIDNYEKEPVFCLLRDWIKNINFMFQRQEKFIGEGKASA